MGTIEKKKINLPGYLHCVLYGHVFYLKAVYCMKPVLNEHFLEEREIITRISGWIQRPMFWPHKGEARAFNSTPTSCNQLLLKLNSLVKFYRKVLNLWCERHMVVVSLENRKLKLRKKKKPRKRSQKTPPLFPLFSCMTSILMVEIIYSWSGFVPRNRWGQPVQLLQFTNEKAETGEVRWLSVPRPRPSGKAGPGNLVFWFQGSLYCASLILRWLF